LKPKLSYFDLLKQVVGQQTLQHLDMWGCCWFAADYVVHNKFGV